MSSSHARSRLRRITLALSALTLVAAACSNSGDDADSTTAPAATSATTAAPATAAPDESTATTATAESATSTEPAAPSSEPAASTAPASGSFQPVAGVPGVSDDEIDFAVLGTKANNPTGACILDCYVAGIQAYFDWRNSEGGVNGRQMVLTRIVDDELALDKQKALEIVSANDTFATFSAVQLADGWVDIADAGVPLYVWMIHPPEANGHESIFGTREPLCISCLQRQVPYVANVAGAKRVASLGYGVSEASKQCAEATEASVEQYGPDLGLEFGYINDDLAFGLPNGIGPEVTAMKEAGVDFIAGCLDLNGMKTLAQELQRQGMLEQTTLYHSNTYDENFVREAGELFEGDYVQATFRPFEADPAGSQLGDFEEWMERSGQPITELAMNGWMGADLAFQGIVAAGAQFDRASVIAATNTFTEYTAGGLIQPIDLTRQHVVPGNDDASRAANGPKYDCISFVKVTNGEFEFVGDSTKPWSCWPGETSAWSEPVAMNFEEA